MLLFGQQLKLHKSLKKFTIAGERTRLSSTLRALLLLTCVACSSPHSGAGPAGALDNPFAGGGLDGTVGGGRFTGEPGGQLTEDGVILEGPKILRIRVSQDSNNSGSEKSLMRWDQPGNDPPELEPPPPPPPETVGPFVMVQHSKRRFDAVALNVEQQDVSLEGDADGETDISLFFITPKNFSCQDHYRFWACQISQGKYQESQVIELSCPMGNSEQPYGTKPGDANTTLYLQEAPAKSCPNPAPQPVDQNQQAM